MGIFDRIFNQVKNDIMGELVGNVSNNTQTTVNNVQRQIDDEYFYAIIASNFGEYEIKRDVPASEFGQTSYNKPPHNLTFCLNKDGKTAAAIMIIPHNKGRNYPYLGAAEICKNAGITYITFYKHFPNEESYVINRIKSFLQ